MTTTHSLVAAVFGPDQLKIAEWVIAVPDGMPTADIVEEVLSMAASDDSLLLPDDGMVYVALRPAEPADIAGMKHQTKPTIH